MEQVNKKTARKSKREEEITEGNYFLTTLTQVN